MDSKDTKKLKLLETLSLEGAAPSQRELAHKLNVSVGFINAFVKHLVRKGYIKVTTISKNRVRYLLTPKGIVEKTRLTYKYIHDSYGYYRKTCSRLDKLYTQLKTEGCTRVAFYGISDIAELAYRVMENTTLVFSGIIDNDHAGESFFSCKIYSINEISKLKFDRLLITSFRKALENKVELKSKCNEALWVYLSWIPG